eukprot:757589-Hanusia_phi.AAC.1
MATHFSGLPLVVLVPFLHVKISHTLKQELPPRSRKFFSRCTKGITTAESLPCCEVGGRNREGVM